MISAELRARVRHISLRTRRLLHSTWAGGQRSIQKGAGLEFDQIREYAPGDDIRRIDWKGTARSSRLVVKQYRQDARATVYLLVDGSSSTTFASHHEQKGAVIAEIASVLALAGHHTGNNVGLCVFTDKPHHIVRPSRDINHIFRMVSYLLSYEPHQKRTSLAAALGHTMRLKCRDALVVIISDFIDDDFTRPLKLAARKYELAAIRCFDDGERELPKQMTVHCRDSESLLRHELTYSPQKSRILGQRAKQQQQFFNNYGIPFLDVRPHSGALDDVVRFFHQQTQHGFGYGPAMRTV